MKFIRSDVQTIKGAHGIVIKAKPVNPVDHANILDLVIEEGMASKIKMVQYILTNCIEELTIDKKKMDLNQVAYESDTATDADTLECFIEIGTCFVENMLISKEEEKK